MNWGKDDRNGLLRLDLCFGEAESLHFFQINRVKVFFNVVNQLIVFVPIDLVKRGYFLNLLDDVVVMGRHNLRTIFPIGLVSVVFLGIVGSGDHHARFASIVSDRKRKHGSRSHLPEIHHRDAIGRKDICRGFCKKGIVDSTVMGDGYLDFFTGKAL